MIYFKIVRILIKITVILIRTPILIRTLWIYFLSKHKIGLKPQQFSLNCFLQFCFCTPEFFYQL